VAGRDTGSRGIPVAQTLRDVPILMENLLAAERAPGYAHLSD
jgi:hypothetical protein